MRHCLSACIVTRSDRYGPVFVDINGLSLSVVGILVLVILLPPPSPMNSRKANDGNGNFGSGAKVINWQA
jgi:hypothetical protein